MARATEGSMEHLHGALCGYFLRLLAGEIPELVERTTTARDEAGNEYTEKTWVETGFMVRPSAGELAVMAKFLKDNAITGAVADGSELSELEKKLAEKHARRKGIPTSRDVEQAMKELKADLLQ